MRTGIGGAGRSRVKPHALVIAVVLLLLSAPPAFADKVHLKGGAVIQADEVWESPEGVWYRRGGVTEFVSRSRVERVERSTQASAQGASGGERDAGETSKTAPAREDVVVLIHLAGGARMQVDEAVESSGGVWYRRGNLSALISKERVERVERGAAEVARAAPPGARRVYSWTTGRPALDGLIRASASRHGLDPYLVFCVMEQESHFNTRAVSRAGARGLMQLMPGTARRFGVRKVFDPAQNLDGGARYLKELVRMFGGKLDLVLASYNAGEGAVVRYGARVPPYAETRNYVRRVGTRYGSGSVAQPPARP